MCLQRYLSHRRRCLNVPSGPWQAVFQDSRIHFQFLALTKWLFVTGLQELPVLMLEHRIICLLVCLGFITFISLDGPVMRGSRPLTGDLGPAFRGDPLPSPSTTGRTGSPVLGVSSPDCGRSWSLSVICSEHKLSSRSLFGGNRSHLTLETQSESNSSIDFLVPSYV